jgi:subtilisin family serine protease
MRRVALLAVSIALSVSLFAQNKSNKNWFNQDPQSDGIWGLSTEKAYQEFKLEENGKPKIVVAVIDAGTDIDHEDLKSMLWINKNEIADNNIDDDKNGYIDDVNGWNFIGGKEKNVGEDTYESTRLVAALENRSNRTAEEEALYQNALKLYNASLKETEEQAKQLKDILDSIQNALKKTGKPNPSLDEVKAIEAKSKEEKLGKQILQYVVQTGGMLNSPIMKSLKEGQEQIQNMLDYNLNKKFDPRNLVGDNYNDNKEIGYGNNRVNGPKADHGTHVAGIIAADRNNNKGMMGICQMAEIMTVRCVPDGDERDKDVANAIRYAADNGAKVVNMSFGKKISPYTAIVQEAILYAQSKDVLLIHAAGNDAANLESEVFYPQGYVAATAVNFSHWIEVGAMSAKEGKGRVASFSNYGKTHVDVFAPGVDIYSCVPGSEYKSQNGTSMAAPMVCGVAAVVRQNYPNLTAAQTKQIILMSAIPCAEKVLIPGTKKKTKLAKISRTGGIANLYAALVLAEKVSKGEFKLP